MEENAQAIVSDSLRNAGVSDDLLATPFDSIWANSDVSLESLSPITQVMLSDDKIFVVLAVLTIIWVGIILFLVRTDRRIDSLERTLGDRINEDDSQL